MALMLLLLIGGCGALNYKDWIDVFECMDMTVQYQDSDCCLGTTRVFYSDDTIALCHPFYEISNGQMAVAAGYVLQARDEFYDFDPRHTGRYPDYVFQIANHTCMMKGMRSYDEIRQQLLLSLDFMVGFGHLHHQPGDRVCKGRQTGKQSCQFSR